MESSATEAHRAHMASSLLRIFSAASHSSEALELLSNTFLLESGARKHSYAHLQHRNTANE